MKLKNLARVNERCLEMINNKAKGKKSGEHISSVLQLHYSSKLILNGHTHTHLRLHHIQMYVLI